MKTPSHARMLPGMMILLTIAFQALPMCLAQDKKPESKPESEVQRYVVSLVDGSRLVCVPALETLPVETSFAKVDIPLAKIEKITFDKKEKRAALRLMNGDQIQGIVKLESLKVQTSFGEFTIKIEHVEQIANAAAVAVQEKTIKDTPANRNACINNLRMIDAAKEQWAMASTKTDGDAVNVNGIAEYLKGSRLPVCPSGGKYTINVIGADPQCSVPGHSLHGGANQPPRSNIE